MYRLAKKQPFAQSYIWQLQRDYFNSVGIDAWRSGAVPHYITSNPVMGKTYAELVLALLRDLALRGQRTETVYLLELGAGHGRLCYHFFKHFEKYYEHSALPLPPFCYVLSDFTDANLAFLQAQPRLQPYLSLGWLDIARFDVETSSELTLRCTGRTLGPAALAQPLLVVANYFFDTIPQDLFRIKNQTLAHGLLTLTTEADPATLTPAELIAALKLTYKYRVAQPPIYPHEPAFNDLLEIYRQQLRNTHLLFPHIGLRCLQRLQQLAPPGLVLLTADKGEHHLARLDRRPAPKLTTHGSFSLSVNYHAFSAYCTQQGGLALFPRQQPASLDLGCLLFLAEPATYKETLNAYLRFVNDYGPDDFFSLKKLVETHFATLTVRDILAILKLSGYDAHLFGQMFPRLQQVLPEISQAERQNLLHATHQVWDTYYPLGEKLDLAFALGFLLMALDFYPEARFYFQMSRKIYGEKPETLYNLAVCYAQEGALTEARAMVAALRVQQPEVEAVLALEAALNTEAANTHTHVVSAANKPAV